MTKAKQIINLFKFYDGAISRTELARRTGADQRWVSRVLRKHKLVPFEKLSEFYETQENFIVIRFDNTFKILRKSY